MTDLRAEQADTGFPAIRGPLRIHRSAGGALGLQSVSGSSTPRPVDSISSTNGVGAANPVPIEVRTVHRSAGMNTAESRGLKNVP